jgi:hypothetical protein
LKYVFSIQVHVLRARVISPDIPVMYTA